MHQSTEFRFSLDTLPKMQSKMAQRLLLIVVGALYPLGFSPINLWLFSFISIFFLINEILTYCSSNNQLALSNEKLSSEKLSDEQKNNKLSLFSIGLYWSYGAFGVGTSWVYVSIHDYGHVPMLGAIGVSFLFVLTLSLVKALGIALVAKLTRWFGLHLFVLIIPFAWVVFEFMQTILFSGFPWLFAGYTQTDGPMKLLSTWLGVYGVSWFMLAITSCCVILSRHYFLVKKTAKGYPNYGSVLVSLILFVSVPLLAQLSQSSKITPPIKALDVALVQPNISQEIKWDRGHFSEIIDILYQQSQPHWNADLIVWPEGAIPAYKHQVKGILTNLDNRATLTQTDLLLGMPVYDKTSDLSYGSFISLGKNQQDYHKQVLVPFGEYVPYAKQLRGLIKFLDLPMSSFSPATTPQTSMTFERYDVIPAICYEIAYPAIVHQLMRDADKRSDKPKLLVTVSNDAWFGSSFGPYQHMQMARMRALELGIPLVRSTNDGVTAVVDARGVMLDSLARYSQDTLRFKVPMDYYNTLYRRYGLWGIYSILIFCLVVFGVSHFYQSRMTKSKDKS